MRALGLPDQKTSTNTSNEDFYPGDNFKSNFSKKNSFLSHKPGTYVPQ